MTNKLTLSSVGYSKSTLFFVLFFFVGFLKLDYAIYIRPVTHNVAQVGLKLLILLP
jgi:hypothetical protein